MLFLCGPAATQKTGHRNVIEGTECELEWKWFMVFENKFAEDCSTKHPPGAKLCEIPAGTDSDVDVPKIT